jgi:hypothetical protein
MDNRPLPIFLNTRDKVVFWTWTEVYWFLGVLGFVWVICSFLLGLLCGAATIKGLRVLEQSPFGDLTRVGLYAFLPSERHFKYLPPSDIREFVG